MPDIYVGMVKQGTCSYWRPMVWIGMLEDYQLGSCHLARAHAAGQVDSLIAEANGTAGSTTLRDPRAHRFRRSSHHRKKSDAADPRRHAKQSLFAVQRAATSSRGPRHHSTIARDGISPVEHEHAQRCAEGTARRRLAAGRTSAPGIDRHISGLERKSRNSSVRLESPLLRQSFLHALQQVRIRSSRWPFPTGARVAGDRARVGQPRSRTRARVLFDRAAGARDSARHRGHGMSSGHAPGGERAADQPLEHRRRAAHGVMPVDVAIHLITGESNDSSAAWPFGCSPPIRRHVSGRESRSTSITAYGHAAHACGEI